MGDLVVGGLSVVLAYRFGRTTRDIPLAIPFSIIFAATPRPRHRSDPADRGSAPGEELVGRIPHFGFRHGFLFVVMLLRRCCAALPLRGQAELGPEFRQGFSRATKNL